MNSGEWNGIIKDILDGEADVSAASMGVTELRTKYVDFSLPIQTEWHAFYISKEISVAYDLYFQPFSWLVWCIVMIIVVIGALIFHVIISYRMDKHYLEFSLSKCFVYVYGAYGGFSSRRWSVTPENISAR